MYVSGIFFPLTLLQKPLKMDKLALYITFENF